MLESRKQPQLKPKPEQTDLHAYAKIVVVFYRCYYGTDVFSSFDEDYNWSLVGSVLSECLIKN